MFVVADSERGDIVETEKKIKCQEVTQNGYCSYG